MEFCKAFNAATQDLEKAAPIPTVITVYARITASFTTKNSAGEPERERGLAGERLREPEHARLRGRVVHLADVADLAG